MLVSQVLIIFEIIRNFSGLTLEEIGEKIHEQHGDLAAAKYLVFGEDTTLLRSRIEELSYVEQRDKRYYYRAGSEVYSKDNLLNNAITFFLQAKR